MKNMEITYTTQKNYTQIQVQKLFQSVDWRSADYPERLKIALDNCETVITAWDNGELVGLINAIDDGELTAYVHYLCVNPDYQGKGVGKELIRRVQDKYENYLYLILIAENKDLIKYYKSNGFEKSDGTFAMSVTNHTADKIPVFS